MRDRLFVPVLGLGQIIGFASSYYLLGVLADPIAQSTGAAASLLFAALSGAFLVSALLTPASGWAIERYGGRRVQAFAHIAFAGALFLMAAATTLPVLWLGIAALGLGMGTGLYGTAFAIVVEKRGPEARRGITAVSLIGALGGGLGWPISRAFVQAGDWRLACLFWALSHLLICLPLTLAVLPKASPVRSGPRERTPLKWDRRMIQMAGIFAGAWMVSTAMGAHLPRVLDALGMSASTAAWAAGLMAASAIAARLFDLLVMHRAHPLITVRLACLLHPLGAVCALSAPLAAPLLAIGQGAGNGLLSVASGVLPLHVFGPDRYAVRQALLLTPARYLQAAAPAAYAWALDGSVAGALLLSSALCLAMLVLTFGLHGKASPALSAPAA
ncbi:MAG TPA: MFS transporter [Brevundimonas sp.]|jgi:MFS family permease|uniref:MFS transporter n=1 Tax=Brevundimonas sp. TaxID=1871086 RepID=UPI002EDB4D02